MLCEKHGWNQPCHCCGAERYNEDWRMAQRTAMGRIGLSIAKMIAERLCETGVPTAKSLSEHT